MQGVTAAGWEWPLADEKILKRLFELNQERAGRCATLSLWPSAESNSTGTKINVEASDTTVAATIDEIEADIDQAFGANALKEEGYAQAVWTLLSQTEDSYLKAIHTLTHDVELHIFADIRLNALTYPLRVCNMECPSESNTFRNELIDAHYQLAWEWLTLADHSYYNFCSIFPLWHRGKVEITVHGSKLVARHAVSEDKAYEAYNRLIRKDAKPEKSELLSNTDIGRLVLARTSYGKDWFTVNFDPSLVAQLVASMLPVVATRHSLPAEWQLDGFTLEQYKKLFITIQAMLWGWLVARNVLAQNGLQGVGYRSAVWLVAKDELGNRVRRYTDIEIDTVTKILKVITFGSFGIRNPDIATQPLLDLRNGLFALSPFVWLNTNAERNLCVLLNQIPGQKQIYDRLKNEKESLLRAEVQDFLATTGLDIRSGAVDGTDLDIAIVDRGSKDCLCLELKWFIEPAEIREVQERTEELREGVSQAKRIKMLYDRGDARLMHDILDIDSNYSFMSAVASQNWIGHFDAQDPEIPIVKLWHLLHTIKNHGSLRSAMEWLSNRNYMPTEGADFEIVPIQISCGKWNCEWYGIKPLVVDGERQNRAADN